MENESKEFLNMYKTRWNNENERQLFHPEHSNTDWISDIRRDGYQTTAKLIANLNTVPHAASC